MKKDIPGTKMERMNARHPTKYDNKVIGGNSEPNHPNERIIK